MKYQCVGGPADGEQVDVPEGVCVVTFPCAYKVDTLAVELFYQKTQRGDVTTFDFMGEMLRNGPVQIL